MFESQVLKKYFTMHLTDIFISSFTLIYIILATIGTGSILLKKHSYFKNIYFIALSYLTGIVFVSLLVIFASISLASPYNNIFIAILLIVPAIKAIKLIVGNKLLRQKLISIMSMKLENKALFALLFSALLINALHSFLPQTGWDEIVYHEPVAKEISEGIVEFPFLQDSPFNDFYKPFSVLYGSFPYASETFVSLSYLLGGVYSLSAILYFVSFLFFLILLNLFIKKFFELKLSERLILLILISTSHNIVLMLSTSYIDLNIAIYQFMSIILLNLGIKKNKSFFIVLSILFVGYTVGMKYTSLVFLVIYAFYLLYLKFTYKSFIITKNLIVWSALAFFVSSGFWYLKNLYFYNNPIYPFIFGHTGISDETYRLILETQAFERYQRNIGGFIESLTTNFKTEQIVVLALFIPMIRKIKREKSRLTTDLLFLSIILYVVNFLFFNQIFRYFLVVLLFLYFLLALLMKLNTNVKYILLLLGFSSIIISPLRKSIWMARIDNTKLYSRHGVIAYLSKNVGCAYDTLEYIKNNDKDAVTINFWDPYASVFFDDVNLLSYQSYVNKDNKSVIKYYYLNEMFKKDFVNSKDFHKDLDIDKMLVEDKNITKNSKPMYVKDRCTLYLIKQ